jgi:hypothetical protein
MGCVTSNNDETSQKSVFTTVVDIKIENVGKVEENLRETRVQRIKHRAEINRH